MSRCRSALLDFNNMCIGIEDGILDAMIHPLVVMSDYEGRRMCSEKTCFTDNRLFMICATYNACIVMKAFELMLYTAVS